jgi:hypothetical protein
MMVSGGVSEDVDMAGNGSKKSGGFGPPWEPAGSYTIDMRWIAQLRRF